MRGIEEQCGTPLQRQGHGASCGRPPSRELQQLWDLEAQAQLDMTDGPEAEGEGPAMVRRHLSNEVD